MKPRLPSVLVLTIIVALVAIPVTAKPAGGREADNPGDSDLVLPSKAVSALLATPWVIKSYHGANPIRLQSRHVPEGAKLAVNKTPVVVDAVQVEEVGVNSSVPRGQLDRQFLEDETVKKVISRLQPLKGGRAVSVAP